MYCDIIILYLWSPRVLCGDEGTRRVDGWMDAYGPLVCLTERQALYQAYERRDEVHVAQIRNIYIKYLHPLFLEYEFRVSLSHREPVRVRALTLGSKMRSLYLSKPTSGASQQIHITHSMQVARRVHYEIP